MLKGSGSYWSTGSTADVVKADKKGPKKAGPKGAAGAGAKGAKGVKVGAKGAKKGARARIANKDPKVLKAQQAAKQLLAAKKVPSFPPWLLV
jgi:hypothetical protein